MKRLLKVLGILAFTIVPTTSVVACGSHDNAPVVPQKDDDGLNIEDLLSKLQDKINEEFGNLINDGKNLFSEAQFQNGSNYYKVLNSLPSDNSAEIKDNDFISAFSQRIQELITNNIVPKLLEDSDLRLLFNGITNTDILKIVNNDTKFYKATFKWKKEENVDFGISNYDPNAYNIIFWYQIRMELGLKISYKNAENKQTDKDVTQIYISYFANTEADIKKVIDASSLEINKTLQNKLISIDITKDEDNSDQKRITIAQNKISSLINNKKLVIENSTFVKGFNIMITSNKLNIPNYKIYREANKFYNAFKLSKNNSIKNLEDYFAKRVVGNFDENLDKFSKMSYLSQDAKSTINTNKQKINAFGKIEINNWTISGLTLKSFKLDFINIRTDQTKAEWTTFMSEALGKIFAIDSWLKNKFDIINKEKKLIMFMDKTDFESYVKKNKSLYNVSTYFNDKIKAKAVSERAINDNTQFRFELNGCNNPNATLGNSEFVTKIDDDTLQVIKNPEEYYSYISVTLDRFHFILGSKKDRGNYRNFNSWIIKKGNSTIWN